MQFPPHPPLLTQDDVLILTFWAPFPSGLECQPIFSVPVGISPLFFCCVLKVIQMWCNLPGHLLGQFKQPATNEQRRVLATESAKRRTGQQHHTTCLQTYLFSCSGRSAIRQRLNLAFTRREAAKGFAVPVSDSVQLFPPEDGSSRSNPGAWHLLSSVF